MNRELIQDIATRVLTHLELWRNTRRALTREELCNALDCDDRALRIALRELRCEGHLIVAEADGGYRFAQAGEEVYGFTATLKSRIKALREVTEAMEDAAQRQYGPPAEQLSLL